MGRKRKRKRRTQAPSGTRAAPPAPTRTKKKTRPASATKHPPQPNEPRRWTLPAAWLLIVLCGSLAYSNSFNGPFIFDDVASIPDNRSITGKANNPGNPGGANVPLGQEGRLDQVGE